MMLTAAEYQHIYEDTRSTITALSGLTQTALDDAAIELSVDYELFLADYRGSHLRDTSAGFAAMLHQWRFPWPAIEESALNGLTIAQFFLVWSWEQSNVAKYLLGGEAVANGWEPDHATNCGIVAAMCAAESLLHAKSLMVYGGNTLGQEAVEQAPAASGNGWLNS